MPMIPLAARRSVSSPLAVGVSAGDRWWLSGGVTVPVHFVYVPYGAASLAASKVNLDNPGTNDAYGAAFPNWSALRGWYNDISGTDRYAQSGVAVANNQTYIVKYANYQPSRTDIVVGARTSGTNGMFIEPNAGTGSIGYAYGGVRIGSATPVSAALAIAGKSVYKDGLSDGADIPAGTITSTVEVWVMTLNDNGSPLLSLIGDLYYAIAYDGVLTPAQIAAVYAAAPI